MKKIITILTCLILILKTYCQVGINTTDPDQSSMLDIRSDSKGLLIPTMGSTMREGIVNPADGLLVFDNELKVLATWIKLSETKKYWTMSILNAPISFNKISGNVVLSSAMLNGYRIGIGTTSPASMFHVAGTVTANALNVTGSSSLNTLSVTGTTSTNSLSASTNITAGGTVTAANYANNAHGNGPIPAGGIIMWSGAANNLPVGWVLCDGNNGTPDLRNRFIVGAGKDAAGYTPGINGPGTGNYHVGDTAGGQDLHKLILNEMPNHTHGVSTGRVAGDGFGNGPTPAFGVTDFRAITNVNTPHENRPPFYALAFIMKLP